MPKRALNTDETAKVQTSLTNAITVCRQIEQKIDKDNPILQQHVGTFINMRFKTLKKGLKDDFAKIREALEKQQVSNIVVEQNNVDWIAEVDPDDLNKITLTSNFFDLSRNGWDTMGGTLIHEASHWLAVRGTDDHAYSKKAAKTLSSTLARNNADNFEYIAEAVANDWGLPL